MEINLNKLMEENEKIGAQTREYRKTCANLESELEKSKELNRNLVKSREDLKIDLDELKEQFNRSLDDKSSKLDLNDEKINSLQLELTKCNSKLDEACLQLNEAKKNYMSQLKQVSRKFYFILLAKMLWSCRKLQNISYCILKTEMGQKSLKQKEMQHNELRLSYEACLIECQQLAQINVGQKQDYEYEIRELRKKVKGYFYKIR